MMGPFGNPAMPPDRRARAAALRAGLSLAWLAIVVGCSRPAVVEAPPAAVRVARFGSEIVSSQLRFSATLKERQKVELSFKIDGTVKELYQVYDADGRQRDVQEGDMVPRGAVIAQLDTVDYQRDRDIANERLEQARAREKAAAAAAEQARRDFARVQRLVGTGNLSRQELDAADARTKTADAEADAAVRAVSTADLQLREAADRLTNCALEVPIDHATVARRDVDRNERIRAHLPVFLLLDVSQIRAVFGVPDTLVSKLEPEQKVNLFSDAFRGETFSGRVTKISPAADERTRTFLIEVTIDQPSGIGPGKGLRPGMVVTINLGEKREAHLLPMTAVQRGASPRDFAVFQVVEEHGQTIVRKRKVALGGVIDNRISVVPGEGTQIHDGDRIVTVGAARLRDGQVVQVLDEPEVRPEI